MKTLVSAEDVKAAATKGEKMLYTDGNTLVTPAAADLAKDLGVELTNNLKQTTRERKSKVETFDYDLQSIQETRYLARQAKQAQTELAKYDSQQIEKIICNMVKVAEENAVSLAKLAVEETGFGKVQDKVFKNQLASTELYKYIKPMQTVGIIKEDQVSKIVEIAEPVGLLMGIIPSTNPTSTTIYKAIIAIKSRNGIVFSPHPSALKCTLQAAKLMNDAAVAAGAPEQIIGCISKPSMNATNELMKCDEIDMIIATGGSAMVKAAYSAGKPALGVGPGNVPAYIEKTADIAKAVRDIMISKTFDNGTICASEQAVIVEECIRDQVMEEFRRQGGYFMIPEETNKVASKLFLSGHAMNAKLVGRSAEVVAANAGIAIPPGTKVLLGEQQGVGKEYPLSYEKLTTVLAFYTVGNWQEACELCIKLLNNGGVGHSLVIHTKNPEIAMKFSGKPVFRILVNTPSTHGGVGASTGLAPAFTLGCGTWGGSATSDNVTPLHLINIKRVAYEIKDCSASANSPYGAEVEQSTNGDNISDEQIMNVVNEVLTLLKESGD